MPRPALALERAATNQFVQLTIIDPLSGLYCHLRLDAYGLGDLVAADNALYYPVRDQETRTLTLWQHSLGGQAMPLPFTTTPPDPGQLWFDIFQDGMKLVWTVDGEVNLADLNMDTTTQLWHEDPSGPLPTTIKPLHLSSEENRLYFVREPRGIGGGPSNGRYTGLYTLSLAGGEPEAIFECQGEFNWCLNDVDFERRLLAYVTEDATGGKVLNITDFDGAAVATYSPLEMNYLGYPLFGPTGDVAFVVAQHVPSAGDLSDYHSSAIQILTPPYTDQAQTLWQDDEGLGSLWGWLDADHLIVVDYEGSGPDRRGLYLLNLTGESRYFALIPEEITLLPPAPTQG